MFTSNKFNSNNNKIKNLCTWCTKTCVWKSAVLSLTVAFKNFRYFFYSIKHKFFTFKISLYLLVGEALEKLVVFTLTLL